MSVNSFNSGNLIFKHTGLGLLLASSLALTSTPAFSAGEILGLGDLPGGAVFSASIGVSGDGSVVVGRAESASGTEAFRWTQAGGMVGLGDLAGGIFSSRALGVSDDGSVVVGLSSSASGNEAFRWTQAGGMVGLGDLAGGGFNSLARAVSNNGSVVVGRGESASGNEAFRWTQAGGMVGLGDLAGGGFSSQAFDVSHNGSVVVGSGLSASGTEAFRWTQAGGMVGLGDLAGGVFSSAALGVSNNGSVVVGRGTSASGNEAFRWTQAGGMVGLGDLAGGGFFSAALGVSDDGNVIVGDSDGAAGFGGFRWTQAGGMQSVTQWLIDNGVAGAPVTGSANAVNNDGSVVVGRLASNEAYIARVSAIGSGLVTLADINNSLASTAQGVGAIQDVNIIINGAHSRPMSHRVAEGQKTMWLAGDWGHDNHNAHDGTVGLAEISGGYNFGPAQVNISLGKTWSKQDLIHGGDIDADGKYILLEAITPLSVDNGLYATVGVFHLWGDADIDRGYINAGLPDSSKASPDFRTWSLRARIDWEDAFTVASAHLSPYADLSYTDSHIDSYTETGGGFPAYFDNRDQENTELRVGINAAMPLAASSVQLIGNLGVVHRFNDEGASTSGQLLGLSSFDLDGHKYDSTWLRAGVGVEGEFGEGKASLMLNGTTEGEMASTWLAGSYQIIF